MSHLRGIQLVRKNEGWLASGAQGHSPLRWWAASSHSSSWWDGWHCGTFCLLYEPASQNKIKHFKLTKAGHQLTTPSGSIRSRCFLVFSCMPDSTYWPSELGDSLTRKSPSFWRRRSASERPICPWNQISFFSSLILSSSTLRKGCVKGSAKNQNKTISFIVQ